MSENKAGASGEESSGNRLSVTPMQKEGSRKEQQVLRKVRKVWTQPIDFVCVHGSKGTVASRGWHGDGPTTNSAEPLVPTLLLLSLSQRERGRQSIESKAATLAWPRCIGKGGQQQSRSDAAVALRKHPHSGRWYPPALALHSPNCFPASLTFSHPMSCITVIDSDVLQHPSSIVSKGVEPLRGYRPRALSQVPFLLAGIHREIHTEKGEKRGPADVSVLAGSRVRNPKDRSLVIPSLSRCTGARMNYSRYRMALGTTQGRLVFAGPRSNQPTFRK